MQKVPIVLVEDALLELQAVLLDDDPEAALEFIKRHLVPQLPRKGSAACDSTRLNPFLLRAEPGRRGGIQGTGTR